jgi:chromosome partitioning protein
MKIVAIAMQKGGVGKSTLTRSLAVAASNAGLMTLALDMDLQQSVTQWSRRRPEGSLPAVMFVTELDLLAQIERARDAGCDLVVIDTPPAASSQAGAAVECADLVLIPCTPDIEAYEQLPRTARLARNTGTPAVAVLTMATPNGRNEAEVARVIFDKSNVPMAPVVIHRLKVHRDASRGGQSAQELTVDSRGAAEIAELWAWLSAELRMQDRVTPMKRRA